MRFVYFSILKFQVTLKGLSRQLMSIFSPVLSACFSTFAMFSQYFGCSTTTFVRGMKQFHICEHLQYSRPRLWTCFSYRNWTLERETSSRAGARVLKMLTNVELLHSPDKGCSWTTEILGKHGDNKRRETSTKNKWEYKISRISKIRCHLNTIQLTNQLRR